MRYRSALLLAFLPVCVFAENLTVSLQVQYPPSPIVMRALQHEVETLLAPSGIQVEWQTPGDTSNRVVERIAVMRLRGQCRAKAWLGGADMSAESLGQTHVVDGHVLPTADVLCDAVSRFIGKELARTRAEERDSVLGRALGRVMAHELYHILLRTRIHGSEGIARPAQSSAELAGVRSAFSKQDEHRLARSGGDEADASDFGR